MCNFIPEWVQIRGDEHTKTRLFITILDDYNWDNDFIILYLFKGRVIKTIIEQQYKYLQLAVCIALNLTLVLHIITHLAVCIALNLTLVLHIITHFITGCHIK